ncbi:MULTISPECIES: siroheme decarboxylase subunit beta [Halomicrobium]|uniref:siroheme decarboxylase n=2 Tax=Halomicrobium mukohataei TaxID=57705 RepID=C7P3M7_HALMD|nr:MULTISPECIES: Lrp/AsnC family transcriptional regulator [Halomicrobium]ACV47699.1 putative transcriptional regulator, AsnC family [Halomicrobium mukohataei DSM 12286]QCD66152.1 Lrp/AsnC family transcriptional regulator [Halomicrobium mukohataei]QFR20957.1 Lrp/AsnC family transcriptional regulator [Halomicrobium sp. ZPS1]
MSLRSGDWRERIDDVDATLIDGYQSGFPVEERPFETVGTRLGIDADDALERVQRLLDDGVFRRFGPVLNPPVIGSSALAAISVPDERFDECAEIVNGYEQVNHNYARDHEWNMWFVVTASTRERRDEILAEIESRTGCSVLALPMLTDYYIDLEFPVVNTDRFARESLQSTDVSATRISESAAADLTPLARRLLLAIQDGMPLSATPYRDLAASVDAPVPDVLATIERLREDGCIKRIGCVVNHVATGFDSNCMVVWDVPDDELDERGRTVGELPYVTLCYHRPRRPEQDWPYNLFTMIHGRESDAVDAKIDELANEYLPDDHERLYSTATLKQTGARYDDLVGN